MKEDPDGIGRLLLVKIKICPSKPSDGVHDQREALISTVIGGLKKGS